MQIETRRESAPIRRQTACWLLTLLALAGATSLGCEQSNRAGEHPPAAKAASADASAKSNPPIPIAGAGDAAAADPESTRKAREILDRMAKAYQNAQTYADRGELEVTIVRPDQPDEDRHVDMGVTFARPNKVRINCRDTSLVSDGLKLRATDESIRGVALEVDSPSNLKLIDLFACGPLQEGFARGVSYFPIQLRMLLPERAAESLFSGSGEPKLLPDDTFDGATCHRVEVDTLEGPARYWIDAESDVLRLLQLPTDGLRKELEAQGPVTRLAASLIFHDAQLNQPVPDKAFTMELPAGTRQVKRLLAPPLPLTKLLGEKISKFNFAALDGATGDQKPLGGKVAVIVFWTTNSGPCAYIFPALSAIHEKYRTNHNVAFLAVNIDPAKSVEDKTVRELAQRWGASFPLARDPDELADKTFQVGTNIPAMFVVGPNGVVENYEVGVNNQLATELPATIDALLAGKSTAAAVKAGYEKRLADYERAILQPPSIMEAIPEAKILPRDEPKSSRLTRAWSTNELKSPGNIMVVEDPKNLAAAPKLLALDGSRTVVELDRQGKVVARHELPIPPEAIVTFIRTAVDGKGHRYYACSANGQQHLYLFDADWKLLVTYPPADDPPHAGIGDVQLADLAGHGELMLGVGHWQLVGVHGVSLAGKHLWSDRSMQNELSLAASPADSQGHRRFLCTNSRGSLVSVSAAGQPDPNEMLLPGLMIATVVSADVAGPGKTSVGVLGHTTDGDAVAVGLGPRGEAAWHYSLPQGFHRTPVEQLTTAPLTASERCWLIAGADGSIHWIAADGKPVDSFHYGLPLTGLAGARFGDETLLLVSTAGKLEAWRVERKIIVQCAAACNDLLPFREAGGG